MSVVSLVCVFMSSSAGSPLLVHCTLACVGSVLFCVWCLVSLVGALHIVLVSFCLVGFLFLFVLYCVRVKGWEFLTSGRRGSIPWRVWRAGSVWGCSLP